MSLLGQQGAGEVKWAGADVERVQQAAPDCVRQACGEAWGGCSGQAASLSLEKRTELSRSVASDSETPWTVPRRPLCPWDAPGKNTGVGCHALLQGISLTQGSNLCLSTCIGKWVLHH